MIVFDCPTCKAKLQVAEEHAGRTIQCPSCKGMASAPANEAIIADGVTVAAAPAPPPPSTAVTTPELAPSGRQRNDDFDDRPRRPRDPSAPAAKAAAGMGIGMILAIVFGVGCCVVVPVLVALLIPAVQKVREAAARTQSTNNLKQIGIAFHAHHDTFKRLPYNGSNEHGKAANPQQPLSGSWAYQILPFIEQQPMFMTVDRNSAVPTYLCPGRGRPGIEAGGGAWSDYFYNNYLNNAEQASLADAPDRKPRMTTITDGTSNTIVVGHGNLDKTLYGISGGVPLSTNIFNGGTFGTARAGANGVTSPPGVMLRRDDNIPPTFATWGGPFPQGALMAMGDGTVRMFPYNTLNFSVFLTPNGGEAAILP